MHFKEIRFEDVEWTELARDILHCLAVVYNVMKLCVPYKAGHSVVRRASFGLLNKNTAPSISQTL
jgi:hypothetical protein